jgi:hypothetical protein
LIDTVNTQGPDNSFFGQPKVQGFSSPIIDERKREGKVMIRKLRSGEYRLYSKKKDEKTGKRKNLGTFKTREAAEKHEREVQYFKRH